MAAAHSSDYRPSWGWRIGTGLLAVVTLLVTAAAAFLLYIDLYPDRAMTWVTPMVSQATGREFSVGPGTDLRLISWRPRLILNDVSFANADWSKDKHMFEAKRVELALALRRLLRQRTTAFSRVRLDDASLRLEQKKDGTNNWTLWTAEVAKPEDRSDIPAIRRLDVRDSRVVYLNEGAAEPVTDLQLDRLTGVVAKEVKLKGQGRYQKNAASIDVRAGSIAQLQDVDAAFPINADIRAGTTSASMKGHLVGVMEAGGLDVTMKINGESLSDLYSLIGIVLPETPPYTLTGKLGREGKVWKFTNFDGRMGDSDLSGDLKVDLAPEPPLMTANLRSKMLDFDDLAGLIGAPPATGAGETASQEQKQEVAETTAEGRVLPDQKINVPKLQAMDIDARLVAARVNPPNHLPIDKLDLHLTLNDGILRADPASFDVAGGRVEMLATLKSTQKPVHVDVDLKARGVEAARILGKTPFTEESGGKLGGGVKLAMTGSSLREFASTADGTVQLALADARVSHLLLEVMGLDIMEGLGVLISGDKPVTIGCAAFDLRAVDGKLTTDLAVIDTTDTNITADLSLNLDNEHLSMRVVPHPKDVSLLALRQDLIVEGKLNDLDFYPDPLKLGPVKSAMQKLNYVLAPFVGLVTPFDLGRQDDDDDNGCAQFLAGQKTVNEGKTAVLDKRLLPATKAPAVAAGARSSKSSKSPPASASKSSSSKKTAPAKTVKRPSSDENKSKGEKHGGGFLKKLRD